MNNDLSFLTFRSRHLTPDHIAMRIDLMAASTQKIHCFLSNYCLKKVCYKKSQFMYNVTMRLNSDKTTIEIFRNLRVRHYIKVYSL